MHHCYTPETETETHPFFLNFFIFASGRNNYNRNIVAMNYRYNNNSIRDTVRVKNISKLQKIILSLKYCVIISLNL